MIVNNEFLLLNWPPYDVYFASSLPKCIILVTPLNLICLFCLNIYFEHSFFLLLNIVDNEYKASIIEQLLTFFILKSVFGSNLSENVCCVNI